MEDLAVKTEKLTVESARMKKKSTEVHNVMWWKNKKFIFVIVIVVLVCLSLPLLICRF